MKKNTLLYVLPIFFVVGISLSISVSFIGEALGDYFVVQDKFTQAIAFYQLAQITDPFNSSLTKRLLAAHLSLDESKHPEQSEEASDTPALSSLPQGQFVLGSSTQVPVLMYHYIRINPDPNDKAGFNLSVTPSNFSSQLDWLAAHGYHTITLDALGANLLYGVKLPSKPIVITLDDGYQDAYTAAFPILKAHSMQAVDFVITGFVGLPRYLTWDEITIMQQSGVFEMEAHTVNHPALTSLSDKAVMQELSESKKDLEQHLGVPINWFAYPSGNVNETVATLVQKVGYLGAFGTQLGTFESTHAMYTLPRVRVSGGESVENFGTKLPWN